MPIFKLRSRPPAAVVPVLRLSCFFAAHTIFPPMHDAGAPTHTTGKAINETLLEKSSALPGSTTQKRRRNRHPSGFCGAARPEADRSRSLPGSRFAEGRSALFHYINTSKARHKDSLFSAKGEARYSENRSIFREFRAETDGFSWFRIE